MDDRVSEAISAAFPDRDVTDVSPPGPSWNDANETVRVTFTDGSQAYVKVGMNGDPSRIRRERAVVAYVGAHTGVPVPEVVACDVEHEPPYLATAPMDGTTLLEPWDAHDRVGRRDLARAVGRTLACGHACRFERHGHVIGGSADGLDLEAAPWPDVLHDRVEWLRDLASTDRFADHFDRVRDAINANRDLLADAPAALLHGDPAMPNTTWDGEVAGFLDWELAYVGDPARDLYRARSQQLDGVKEPGPADLVAALHDGYRDVAGGLPDGYPDRKPLYRAVRFLGTSGYVDKLVEFVDEEEDAFAAWVDAEMDRRLAAVET